MEYDRLNGFAYFDKESNKFVYMVNGVLIDVHTYYIPWLKDYGFNK